MLLEEYINSCINFSIQTQKWGSLDKYKFYLTDGAMCYETSDGDCPGQIDVSWAFHKTEQEIRETAAQTFINLIHDQITCAVDNDLSNDEIGELVDKLLDSVD